MTKINPKTLDYFSLLWDLAAAEGIWVGFPIRRAAEKLGITQDAALRATLKHRRQARNA